MHAMTKRQAIREARDCANAVIEQMERWSKGWDKGAFRDDDTWRRITAKGRVALHINHAFRLSAQFANK